MATEPNAARTTQELAEDIMIFADAYAARACHCGASSGKASGEGVVQSKKSVAAREKLKQAVDRLAARRSGVA
ncbi:MAG: hypothetical protein ACREPQ_14235 [Rhodanobacter sp.]